MEKFSGQIPSATLVANPLSKVENILRAWLPRIKLKDLLEVKSDVRTDQSTEHTARYHQNQTWQFVRFLPKVSFSINFSTYYQVNTRTQMPYLHSNSMKDVIQTSTIQYLPLSSIQRFLNYFQDLWINPIKQITLKGEARIYVYSVHIKNIV